MKKLFILLIVLSYCLKLSAYVRLDTIKSPQKDSLKIAPPAKHKHKTKFTPVVKRADSLNTAVATGQTDSTIMVAPVSKQDSLRALVIMSHADSLRQSLLAQPDSLKLTPFLPVTDSSKAPSIRPDSSKSPTQTVSDSLKVLPAIHHNSGPSLPVSDNYENSPVFFVSIDHLDAPKLSLAIKYRDTVKQKIGTNRSLKPRVKLNEVDSLKELIRFIPNDSLRAGLFTKMAAIYLRYDTVANPKKQLSYQNHALLNTLTALHFYSRYNDTSGLKKSFDNLTKVYFDQGKYSEAKWFILQSNNLSRSKKDVKNIISSLLTLSDIKCQIKDYDLAKKDLDEALQLSITYHYPKIELAVLKSYAILYSRTKNYPKEAAMLKRRDSVQKSIEKTEQDSLIAKLTAQYQLEKKKADSVQLKKKVYTSSIKKPSKKISPKKTDSI